MDKEDEGNEVNAEDLEPENKDSKEGEEQDDSMTEVLLEGLEDEPKEGEELVKESEEEDASEDAEKLANLEKTVKQLQNDKFKLNKALHEARKKKKKDSEKEEPLTDAQLLDILEENKDDPETILRVVKYQAEKSAKEASGKAVSTAEIKRQAKEAGDLLGQMYPSLYEEGSEMRQAVDSTKEKLGLNDNPLGDYFATGVQVLNALPELIVAAEKRGEAIALKKKVDNKRKQSIKENSRVSSKSKAEKKHVLTDTQVEAAKQLNLTEGQLKTYKKIMGSKTVEVKE